MPRYIVIDERKKGHLVEAANPGGAFGQVVGAESVRIAHQVDIEAYENQEPTVTKIKAK